VELQFFIKSLAGERAPGRTDADAAGLPEFDFGLVHQRGDCGDGGQIVILWGRHAAAQQLLVAGVEPDQFNFGAAEVDAET
jgi:hypothetical protein